MNKSIKIKLILSIILMILITIIGNISSFAASAEDTWDGSIWYWDIAALTAQDTSINTWGNSRGIPNPNPYYDKTYLLGSRGLADAVECMKTNGDASITSLWGHNGDYELALSFPHVSCIDPDNNAYSKYTVFGVFDINLTEDGKAGKDPANGKLYFRDDYESKNVEIKEKNIKTDTNYMGILAFDSYAAVEGLNPVTSRTMAESWQQIWYINTNLYKALIKDLRPLDSYPKTNYDNPWSIMPADAENYGNFALSISKANNSTLVGGTTTANSTNSGGVATAGPYSFSKYIVDNHIYDADHGYGNRDKEEPGTCQKITVKAILSNGTTVDNPDIIVNGSVVSDLKTGLKAGDKFTVRVNNAGSATIQTVIFTSEYYTYGARTYFVGGVTGGDQCRNVVTGVRTLQHDEATFTTRGVPTPPTPDTPNPPVDEDIAALVIEKVDENGNRIENVELTIGVDGAYSTGKVKTEKNKDIIIYLQELLANDQVFINQLSDSDLNNAAKLFKDPCDNKIDDIREFIKEHLNEKVWNAVESSTNWKNWNAALGGNHVYNGVETKYRSEYVQNFLLSDDGSKLCPYAGQLGCKKTEPHWHHDIPDGYSYYDLEYDCPKCQAKIKIDELTPKIENFIDTYPINTDTLVRWLENGGFNITSEDSSLRNIFSGGGSDWVDFKFSIYDIYSDSRFKDTVITQKDIIKVLTGDITVTITENSAPSGYIAWKNGATKTIVVKYEEGKITNGIERFSNGYYGDDFTNDKGAYLTDRNDEVEIEHRAITEEPSDGTYEIAKITAYNQTNKEEFSLGKLGDYGNYTTAVNATFEIKITTTESYWNQTSKTKTKTFNKTTERGYINLTAQDFRDIGIDVIDRWTGKIKIEIRETVPPPGFIQIPGTMGMIVEFNKGEKKITTDNTGAYVSLRLNGNIIEMTALNEYEQSSSLIIKKVGRDGVALSGAKFKMSFQADWWQQDWDENTETWVSKRYTGYTEKTGTTGTLGEIILNSDDLRGLGILNFGSWTGTMKITLEELESPNGYNKIANQTITLYYSGGSVTSADYDSNYIGFKLESVILDVGSRRTIPVIIVKNDLDSSLRIRKVDSYGNFLTGARFTGSITASGTSGRRSYNNVAVDNNGYVDLTSTVNSLVGDIGKYTGTLTVTMRETQVPSGYYGLSGEVVVTLIYSNGTLMSATTDNSKVNVGKADNGRDVTIAVTNDMVPPPPPPSYTLEPMYISKVDSQTEIGIPNVGFNITISTREDLNIGNNTLVLNNVRTNQDGLITITTDNLHNISVPDGYNGNVYVAIEEFEANSNYEKLTEEIHLIVSFNNGYVKSITYTGTDAQKQVANDHCVVSNNNNKIKIKNTLKPIDLILQKSTFANGEVFNVEANFKIDVYTDASNSKGHMVTKTLKTNPDGQIIFTGDELRVLEADNDGKFFDGTYTGELYIHIKETSAQYGAAMIPGEVTVRLTLENGRYKSSDDGNSAHISVKTNGNTVTMYVADAMSGTRLFLRGIVWEELATTKAEGTLVDGLYTTSSDSENFDKLFDGIEVTLYKVENGALKFVEVSSGTNPTFTIDGKYEFQISNYVRGNDNYVVKFTFNGMEYTASPITANNALANWELSSKASEVKGESNTILTRNYVNNLMKEIGSYPANYKIENFIFSNASDKFAHEGNTYYNIAYRYEEIAELQKEVSEAIKYYLLDESGSSANSNTRHNNLDITTQEGLNKLIEIYNSVAEKYKDVDSEIYNKLQFIYDTRVSAVAGYYTQDGGIDDPVNVGKYPHSSKKTTDVNGHTVQEGINLGLYKRDRTELHLEKDIKETIVSMNGYDATYSMEELLSSYKQYLYQEDFNYETGENSNGIAWYNNDQIELYVKYKLTVYNTTNTPTKLTEIVDYFDSRFEYADNYKTSKGNILSGIEVYKIDGNGNKSPFTSMVTNPAKDSKYIPASRIGLNGTNNTYTSLYVTFNDGNEPELNAGEKLEVYITIRLGNGGNSVDPNTKVGSLYENGNKNAKDILNDFLNEDGTGTLVANGYAEINGYKAYKKDERGNIKETGFIDAVSKPGNMKVKEYEEARNEYEEASKNRRTDRDRFTKAQENLKRIQENDASGVKLNISTNLDGDPSNNIPDNNPYHRTLIGNVWKASDSYTEEKLEYPNANGLGGIIVELVEIEPDGNQVVRARTVTNADGSYTFTGYIPGDYTVRFSYGETFENDTADGEGFTATQKQAINDTSKDASVNGQYYQSIHANEETDKDYWYAEDTEHRYSDAYDEVTSRLEQIDAQIAGEKTGDIIKGDKTVADKSWSWNYEVDGIENVEGKTHVVEGKTHVDKIEAYTSTLNLEVEYTNNKPAGNKDYANYRYPIVSVDFGLTPRAEAEMNIEKRVSNIKLYMQDGTKQLDVDFNPDGTVERYNNADLYKNTVIPTPGENNASYRDGLIEVLFDTQLLNGTTLEITYTITAKNDGQANTIRYFYNSGDSRNPIAVAYYGEALGKIVYYEGDNKVMTHATDAGKWELKACDGGQKDVEVRTRATNIVDYIDPSLNFIQQNKEGIQVNADWEITSASDFNSSRERTENADVMKKYNTIIRAKGGETKASYLDYLNDYNASTAGNVASGSSVLYTPMKTKESKTTTLTLSTVLGTSSTGTNDYEYSNLMEITKLENYAGKSTKLKAYDITGTVDRETSDVPSSTRTTPTVGTSKSATIVIHEPTGLTAREEAKSNLVIVLVALVILAVGIVLIKKFVLKPRT